MIYTAALSIECPTCGASPDEPCFTINRIITPLTPTGRRMYGGAALMTAERVDCPIHKRRSADAARLTRETNKQRRKSK